MRSSGELVKNVRISWMKERSHRQRTWRRFSMFLIGCMSIEVGCSDSSKMLLELSNQDGLAMSETLPKEFPVSNYTKSSVLKTPAFTRE